MVVTSADETETGEEVFGRTSNAVDANEGWCTVLCRGSGKPRTESKHPRTQSKVILGFKSKDVQNKVKERLKCNQLVVEEVKNKDQLVVEEVKNKDPLLVLRDVLSVNTDDDVLRALRNQNRDIFRGLNDGEDRIDIKYRRKARYSLTGHSHQRVTNDME